MIIHLCSFLLTFCLMTPQIASEYRTTVAMKRGIQDFTNSIPIGVQTYKELVLNSKLFVDNSLLIEEIITHNVSARLYLAPSKFCKTLNLDMIKTFFEIPVDKNGTKILPVNSTFAYKLFRKGEIHRDDGKLEKLEIPPLIFEHKNLIEEYLGQVPVVYIDFKNVTGHNYAEIETQLYKTISKAFQQHKYLLPSIPTILDYDKFENFLNGDPDVTHTLEKTVEFLCEYLHSYYGRKVLVIFDDYDAPLSNILQSPNFPKYEPSQLLKTLHSLFDITFKTNEHLWRGIIAGKYQLLNNVFSFQFPIIHDVMPKRHIESLFFQFNKKDVQIMLEKHNLPKDIIERAHKWYGGYRSLTFNMEFYNPYSVASFLKERTIGQYWSANEINIDKFITKMHGELFLLHILSKRPTTHYENILIYEDRIDYLKTLDGFLCGGYFGYLFRLGYLTPVEIEHFRIITAVIPNNEVTHLIINKWLLPHLQSKFRMDDKLLLNSAVQLSDFVNKYESIDTKALENSLAILYNHCTFPCVNETFVHSIFRSVTLKMQILSQFDVDVYYYTSSKVDIAMANNATKQGIIFELRFDNEQTIQHALKAAENFGNVFINTTHPITTLRFVALRVSPNRTTEVLASFQKLASESTSEKPLLH